MIILKMNIASHYLLEFSTYPLNFLHVLEVLIAKILSAWLSLHILPIALCIILLLLPVTRHFSDEDFSLFDGGLASSDFVDFPSLVHYSNRKDHGPKRELRR